MVNYSLVKDNDRESLIILLNGSAQTVSPEHPNYEQIKTGLVTGATEDEINTLYNARRLVPEKLQRLSERITLVGGELRFDGDVIDNALSRHILRLAQVGDDGLTAFVRFMENLAQNPSHLSRVHLFSWIDGRDFTITDEGHIVGYKSVANDGNGGYLSHYVGTNIVFVDGEAVTGKVPNPIGAVVEMPRSEADDNRLQQCSYGLHIGTWNYASTFNGGSTILKVLVNPRDVVSVPKDSSAQKMRACRYTIVEVIGEEITTPVIFTSVENSSSEFDGPLFEDDEEDSYEEPEELEDEDCGDFESGVDDDEYGECITCSVDYWDHS